MKALFVILFATFFSFDSYADSPVKVKGNCSQGLKKIESGPYSFYFSCEGALGNYVGIILTDQWSRAGSKFWKIGDRFWYEKPWGDDVDSYYIVPKKHVLYIATSTIYGVGGVYRLNLKERKSELVFPSSKKAVKPEYEYTIAGHSKKGLEIQVTDADGKQSSIVIKVD